MTRTPFRLGSLLAGLLLLLTLLAVPAVGAEPAIAVSPTSGAAGTRFVVTGTGFTAGQSVILVVVDRDGDIQLSDFLQISAGGGFQYTINSEGADPGEYAVGIGTASGDVLAIETFTVTGGAGGGGGGSGTGGGGDVPSGPPSTGGGGMARQDGLALTLLAGLGLGIIALSGLAAGLVLRRRS